MIPGLSFNARRVRAELKVCGRLTGGRLRVCIGEHLMCWLFSGNFIRVPCFRQQFSVAGFGVAGS